MDSSPGPQLPAKYRTRRPWNIVFNRYIFQYVNRHVGLAWRMDYCHELFGHERWKSFSFIFNVASTFGPYFVYLRVSLWKGYQDGLMEHCTV